MHHDVLVVLAFGALIFALVALAIERSLTAAAAVVIALLLAVSLV